MHNAHKIVCCKATWVKLFGVSPSEGVSAIDKGHSYCTLRSAARTNSVISTYLSITVCIVHREQVLTVDRELG